MYLPKRLRQRVCGFLRKYYYLKLCFNRAYSYVQTPVDIARDFTIIFVGLTMLGFHNRFVIVLGFVVAVVTAVLAGHFDVKNRFAHIELEVNNQINPQLMSIYEKVNGKGGKGGKR